MSKVGDCLLYPKFNGSRRRLKMYCSSFSLLYFLLGNEDLTKDRSAVAMVTPFLLTQHWS